MKFRKDFTQELAASKADISVSSASRIKNGRHQPKKATRQWRTRPDPLEAVWESVVVPILQQDELITPVGVFDHLCELHSDVFPTTARRTLERRIKKWRQLHGGAKDVMFLQHHESGLSVDIGHPTFHQVVQVQATPHLQWMNGTPASNQWSQPCNLSMKRTSMNYVPYAQYTAEFGLEDTLS
jgi:hypothetical protein|tara:strand:+ start:5904 stop:6452 length:549 start_codon:yes stop_codon:yes gene_type:complete